MSILTRQAVTLPTVTLSIPAPAASSKNLVSVPLTPPSNLKIRITPHVLVSTPPFAPGVSGRKVEDSVDVVVDIGGKLDLVLEVDDESMAWAEGEAWAMEEVARGRVKGLFEANAGVMALSGISSPAIDVSAPLYESPPSQAILRQPLLRLSPLVANPSHSHLIRTLTTTGRPQAVLTRLDIKLEWTSPKAPKTKDDEEEKDDGEEESEESAEVEEGGAWDEDEFCDLLDGAEGSEFGDILDVSGEGTEEGVVLPKWVEAQLKSGIHKVIRTHMIKRYPLLFDSALIEHTSSLIMHRSLTSSLTHFLTLSSTHSTSFLRPARHLLRSIAQEQENFLSLNVNAASSIRGTKTTGARKGKRRKLAPGEEEEVDPQTAKGRAQGYMDQVHAQVAEEDRGPRADERRVGRLVGEAMGRVGRGKWELGRRGVGRMAAFRVPLKDLDVSNEEEEADVVPRQRAQPPTDLDLEEHSQLVISPDIDDAFSPHLPDTADGHNDDEADILDFDFDFPDNEGGPGSPIFLANDDLPEEEDSLEPNIPNDNSDGDSNGDMLRDDIDILHEFIFDPTDEMLADDEQPGDAFANDEMLDDEGEAGEGGVRDDDREEDMLGMADVEDGVGLVDEDEGEVADMLDFNEDEFDMSNSITTPHQDDDADERSAVG